MDGPEYIHRAEVRLAQEEQDRGVSEGKRNGGVSGPLVKREDVHAAMGPVTPRTVSQRHKHAQQHIECCSTDSA